MAIQAMINIRKNAMNQAKKSDKRTFEASAEREAALSLEVAPQQGLVYVGAFLHGVGNYGNSLRIPI